MPGGEGASYIAVDSVDATEGGNLPESSATVSTVLPAVGKRPRHETSVIDLLGSQEADVASVSQPSPALGFEEAALTTRVAVPQVHLADVPPLPMSAADVSDVIAMRSEQAPSDAAAAAAPPSRVLRIQPEPLAPPSRSGRLFRGPSASAPQSSTEAIEVDVDGEVDDGVQVVHTQFADSSAAASFRGAYDRDRGGGAGRGVGAASVAAEAATAAESNARFGSGGGSAAFELQHGYGSAGSGHDETVSYGYADGGFDAFLASALRTIGGLSLPAWMGGRDRDGQYGWRGGRGRGSGVGGGRGSAGRGVGFGFGFFGDMDGSSGGSFVDSFGSGFGDNFGPGSSTGGGGSAGAGSAAYERLRLQHWISSLPPGYNFRPEDYERLAQLDEFVEADSARGRAQRTESIIRGLTVVKMPGKSKTSASAVSSTASADGGTISLDADGSVLIDLVDPVPAPVATEIASGSGAVASSGASARASGGALSTAPTVTPPGAALSPVVEEEEEAARCTVCLEPMLPGEDVAILPCFHKLHKVCIAPWLRVSLTCPICKTKVS